MGEKRGGIFGRCGYRICDRGRQAAMIGLNVHGSDLLAAPDQTPRKKKRSGHRSTIMAGAECQRCPLWAPAACRRAFSIPSKPWTRALVPPASTASLPGGFFRLGVKETWPCGKGGPLCRAARAAAHGGSRGRVEYWSHDSRVGIGRPRRWNLPFVHLLGSLLAPGQPTSPPLPLCV